MRRMIIGMLAAVVVVVACVPASAAVQSGNLFRLTWPTLNPHGNEGPFAMIHNGGGATDDFLTFCAEQREFFYPGSTYQVGQSVLDDSGWYVSGGIGNKTVLTNRNLSGYTAWIYTMFRDDADWHLPSQFATMTQTKYDALQYAVWAGMTTGTPSSSTVGISTAGPPASTPEQQFGVYNGYLGTAFTVAELEALGIGPTAFDNSYWGGYAPGDAGKYGYFGHVQVLNLYGWDGQRYSVAAQDQLGLVGSQSLPPPVPEPMSFVVWLLLALCGCAAACRGRRKKAA